jgi:hypothetical protein
MRRIRKAAARKGERGADDAVNPEETPTTNAA